MNTDSGKWGGANGITEQIIGCAFKVGNALGSGFLEKVYENALVHELRKSGLRVDQQRKFSVSYDGVIVGDFAADVLVEEAVLVEIKAKRSLVDEHVAQSLNYLAATKLPLCLLLNFGRRVEVRRIAGPDAPRLDGSNPCSSVTSVAGSELDPDDFDDLVS